ncbi:MAG TPA: LysR family transcriptional regulator [Candidatus Solibacter sp.]|nr:LysR family transcriptional regulator [Candidatus Solibacter sp.]
MRWLNYQHLYYFRTTVCKGSVAAACEFLRLAPSTVSEQIHCLEDHLHLKLMRRSGKKLVPTAAGKRVYRFAEEIFTLGDDLLASALSGEVHQEREVIVGVVNVLPKLLAHWLIEPALRLREPMHLVCRQGSMSQLLGLLAVGELDVVLSDSPPPGIRMRVYTRMLVECGAVFVASRRLAATYRRDFPRSIQGAPLLVPSENSSLRLKVEQWLEAKDLRPRIAGEFEDHGMLRTFAEMGEGIVPVPSLIERQFRRGSRLHRVGAARGIRMQFYGVTTEKKLMDEWVAAIFQPPAALRKCNTTALNQRSEPKFSSRHTKSILG